MVKRVKMHKKKKEKPHHFRNTKVVDYRYAFTCVKCQCYTHWKPSRISDTFQVLAQGQRVEASRYQTTPEKTSVDCLLSYSNTKNACKVDSNVVKMI